MGNISVTGGSGFIGSNLVDALIKKRHNVSIIDLKRPHRADIPHLKINILNLKEVIMATKNIDFIYHLAAVSDINHAYKDPIRCYNVNIKGTANILEAARVNDVKRVLLASTIWVYSATKDEKVNESSSIDISRSNHIYTSTKIASELLCHDYQRLYGTCFTILRYGIAYGPRARQETVIPIFVKNALKNRKLTIFGDGTQARNFIYVKDLAEGNIASMKENAKNKTYNLIDEKKVTINELVGVIKKLVNKKILVQYKNGRKNDYDGKIISSKLAKRELGWQPRIAFEEGIKRYIIWYRQKFK